MKRKYPTTKAVWIRANWCTYTTMSRMFMKNLLKSLSKSKISLILESSHTSMRKSSKQLPPTNLLLKTYMNVNEDSKIYASGTMMPKLFWIFTWFRGSNCKLEFISNLLVSTQLINSSIPMKSVSCVGPIRLKF